MSRIEEIKGMYLLPPYGLGMTMEDIGLSLGITRQAVQKQLKKAGICGEPRRLKPNPLKEAQEIEILSLAISSLTMSQIAQSVGVKRYRVYDVFTKNGITKNTITRRAITRYGYIYTFLVNHPNVTYKETANSFGVSIHTVIRAAKCFGYKRPYNERAGVFGGP